MPSSELALLQEQLEAFAARNVEPYLDRLAARFDGHFRKRAFEKTKEVNDPIWGTIVMYPLEVFVLDAPLLQRLRSIRQLGIVHWIYPGATHSRFEHSLGALHQVEELIVNIASQTANIKSKTEKIPEGYRRLLRLAALVHDLGHGFMSHISEYSVQQLPAVNRIVREFEKCQQTDRRKLSEIAAFYIINSPAFKKLIDDGLLRTGETVLLNEKALTAKQICEKLADLVLGKRIDDEYPQLQLLISGAFDCDKLDYLSRDARTCGVPEIVDISRLARKISLYPVTEQRLPERLANTLRQNPNIQFYKLLVLKSSGIKALDELLVARLMLFSKVYRHKKALAAEAMVRLIVLRLAEVIGSPAAVAFLPFLFDDEEIIRATPLSLSEALKVEVTDEQQKQALNSAAGLANRLGNRDIFVLGCAIRKPPDAPNDEPSFAATAKMFLELDALAARETFSAKLADEVAKIFEIDKQKKCDFRSSIFLLLSDPVVSNSDIEQTLVLFDDGQVDHYRGLGINLKAWTDAYSVVEALGSLFCSEEITAHAICAIEKIMAVDYKVDNPTFMLMDCRVEPDKLRALKLRLLKSGYYQSLPINIRPIPDAMLNIGFRQRVEKVTEKLAVIDFADKDLGNHVSRPTVSFRIEKWLRQFENDDAILGALCYLEGMEVVARGTVTSSLAHCFQNNPQLANACVCPFGTTKDSSAILGYYAHDLIATYDFSEVTLEEALSNSDYQNKPILFVDDFLGSGGQATGIIDAWFGQKETASLFNEERANLTPANVERLRKRKLIFFFTVGWREGEKALRNQFKKYQLDAEVSIAKYAEDVPSIDRIKFDNESAKSEFRKKSKEMGEQVLRATKPKWDPAKYADRALGYGNRGLAICTTYNVPAHALTVLWCDAPGWASLIPRREKH